MKYFAVVFFVFVIAVIVLADHGSLPHSIRALYDFPNGDKVGHFILFGFLTFILIRAFLSSFPSQPRGWVALSIGLILALLIGLEEWSQQFFLARTLTCWICWQVMLGSSLLHSWQFIGENPAKLPLEFRLIFCYSIYGHVRLPKWNVPQALSVEGCRN